jgi:hypothetical protein
MYKRKEITRKVQIRSYEDAPSTHATVRYETALSVKVKRSSFGSHGPRHVENDTNTLYNLLLRVELDFVEFIWR